MWKPLLLLLLCSTIIKNLVVAQTTNAIPEYVKQCRRDDPKLTECFISSLEHLKPYLAKGIPEIELPSVEPFKMDTLSLQLTDGPQGYKITLKNMDVFGSSEFQVKSMKISENGEPFKARIVIPKLRIDAKYTSSGVLIIIPASGGGDFHAVLDGVICDLSGKVSTSQRDGKTYLHVDSLNLHLDIKNADLKIANAFRNNRVLLEATNLFLRENGHLVIEAMQPQLQKKLAMEFAKLANQLLKHVPRDWFYVA